MSGSSIGKLQLSCDTLCLEVVTGQTERHDGNIAIKQLHVTHFDDINLQRSEIAFVLPNDVVADSMNDTFACQNALYPAGMMDPAYFVGRKAILNWINDTFQLNLSKIEDTASGRVVYRMQ